MDKNYILAKNRFFYELYSPNSPEQSEKHGNRDFYLKGLLDPTGFLKEEIYNPKVKHISEIAELSGAILVAEAGMGKSFVMKYLESQIEEEIQVKFRANDYLNDNYTFGNEIKEIGEKKEYIFIDGLDENHDAIPTILRTLKQHSSNKRVFLATRGIKELKKICTELSIPVYSLLPLSKTMVQDYAASEGIDAQDFIDTISGRNLPPVCRNPLGCNLIIQLYHQNKLAQISNEDLWQQSILMLCSENDSDSKIQSESAAEYVTPEECLKQASKIALILKLSNQNEIDGGRDSYQQLQKDEDNLYHAFWRDIPNLRTVLSRALFVPVGNNYFRFAHESFQEYLVAVGLIAFTQRDNWDAILLSADQDDIYPQWEGVALYLAVLDEEWLSKVLAIRPDIILAFDNIVSKLNHAELLKCTLQRLKDYDFWTIRNGNLLSQLCKLKHSEIIPVLNDVLEKDLPFVQKEIVIDIIREERILELENKLVEVFCNPNEIVLLRNNAGYALQRIATKESRVHCKNVLNEENVPLCLKGHVFSMTWPDLISVSEITAHLTNTEDIDAYSTWMDIDFPRSLIDITHESAIELLEWAVADIKDQGGYLDRLLHMRQHIFTICWKKYNDHKSLPLFADGYYGFLKINRCPFPFIDDFFETLPQELVYTQEDFANDKEKRHNLARELMKKKERSEILFIFYPPLVLSFDDVKFLFDMIACPDETEYKKDWVRCLCYLRNGIPLPEMSDKWNEIHVLYPDIFPNDAETEMVLRKEYDQKIRNQKKEAAEKIEKEKARKQSIFVSYQKTLYQTDAVEYVPSILSYCVQDSRKDIFTYETGNAWNAFSDEDKQTIVTLAKQYLIKNIPFKRVKDNFYPFITVLFLVIYRENRKALDDLPAGVWMEYSRDLFDGIEYNPTQELNDIVLYMKDHFPEDFYKSLFLYAKGRILSSRYFYLSQYKVSFEDSFLKQIAEISMSDFCDNLKSFIILKDIYARNKTVLKIVFENKYPFLGQNATQDNGIIQKTLPTLVSQIGICSIVIVFDLFPNFIHHFLCYTIAFPVDGKAWIESLMEVERHEHWVSKTIKSLSVEEIADLYIWLETNYPRYNRPKHGASFTPTAIDELYFFKERVLSIIAESESLHSVQSLNKIKKSFPEDTLIDDYIKTAKTIELRIKCPLYRCSSIKHLVDKTNMFLINSPQDLLHLVCKTLLDYQDFINGKDTPRIEDLWNNLGKEFTPKSEEDFSDHLKSYLEIFLRKFKVVINREVQLNRGSHGKPGARTDIWVETFSDDYPKKISLCIEVKGSWNPEIKDALNNQLIGKYMDNGAADAGIFLVGWFKAKNCSRPIDHSLGETIEEAQAFLRHQEEVAVKKGHLVKCVVIDCEYRK
ncbi:MAG: hypothetical protein PUC15_02905 [Lentisphaeria bacterium]|nr:hypothetical protein [Lentisphaeria bacterium]